MTVRGGRASMGVAAWTGTTRTCAGAPRAGRAPTASSTLTSAAAVRVSMRSPVRTCLGTSPATVSLAGPARSATSVSAIRKTNILSVSR